MFNMHKLKRQEYIIETVILVAILIFTVAQKLFIETVPMRFLALLAVSLILSFLFFMIVKPNNPNMLSKFLMVFQGCIAALVIIILHVIVVFDFSYKNVLVFLILAASPYIAGAMYKFVKKIKDLGVDY